jgi:predicted glycosyltransferase
VLRNRLYYGIKPLIPRSIRLSVRSRLALHTRERVRDTWPILPGSEKPPEGWPGWPDGKQFALVLTHDVEGKKGLERCLDLMKIEQSYGFRSCFNFIPEGEYRETAAIRGELLRNGFEVGVHDLYHDGKLFQSRHQFSRNATKINQYLKDWGAAGFRAGFMLHNLDWIHELNVQYDASTFDTDPFEPQPHGRHTIFPFWVPRGTTDHKLQTTDQVRSPWSVVSSPSDGYVELPYTLPQDSTLFLLLREQHPDIWFQKLDWIAKHGGMALVNVHPDYMRFNGEQHSSLTYPIESYIRFLEYVHSRYQGNYWNVLPKEVAHFIVGAEQEYSSKADKAPVHSLSQRRGQPKIWIDLDNTPHVPFFEPIIDELKARGYPLLVTARDAFQVCDLAAKKGVQCTRIGRHYGKNRLMKGAGLAYRALQLAPLVLREKPVLGVSHGARSQLLLANLLRIQTLLIEDYEYCQFPFMMHPTWIMAPSVIPDSALCNGNGNGHLRKYPGIKEDVYAWKLKPDTGVLSELGLSESDLVVTVRPPATEAHYHNPDSEKLFSALMDRACQTPRTRVVLLPRNKKQGEAIKAQCPRWFQNGKTVIPRGALDGMNLIWHSDLVVSGGGTMNREAAALGVPVYSIFRGTIGAVDRHLKAENRLVLLESVEDVERKIRLVKRERRPISEVTSTHTLRHIVDEVVKLAELVARKT